MKDLSKRELDNLDNMLQQYRTISQKIFARRQEIIFNKHTDGHEVKAKRIQNPTEFTVMRLDSDIALRNLELFKITVETLLGILTEEQRYLFGLHWGDEQLTWIEIAYKLGKAEKDIARQRKAILEAYGELIHYS